MTYRLTVRRQAKADIREAARWYERQRQIDTLLDRIREDPLQHQVVYRGARRAIPRGSPTAFSTVSTDPLFSCLRWCICIATPPRGRIASPGVKANNAFDLPAGSHSRAAAGQRGRYAHGVQGRKLEGRGRNVTERTLACERGGRRPWDSRSDEICEARPVEAEVKT